MQKLRLTILFSLCILSAMAQHKTTLRIKNLPAFHPSGSNIYLAGSFNGWNPQDKNFMFRRDSAGTYFIELQLADGSYEYKLTRGGWDKAESKKDGASTTNRVLKVEADNDIELIVEEWSDRFPAAPPKSTASRNVKVIDTAFLIPSLQRTRRVWVYLPACYDSCNRRFPVIYMHDGQNLFDNATSYSGEWGIDEYLDTLGSHDNHCIVVAVDHGGNKRLNEYCPYDFELKGIGAMSQSNKGEGKKYVDFLVKTLKPYIDKNYRTARSKDNTAIAGSSMGGLISMYAVLKYPKVFGAAGIFSPAFWVAPGIFNEINMSGKKVRSKIYFYAGKLEGETMVPDMLKAYERMSKVSKAKMQAVIRDNGQHNEPTWRREFPLFYQWINQQPNK